VEARQSVGPAEHVARAAEAIANCGVLFGWCPGEGHCAAALVPTTRTPARAKLATLFGEKGFPDHVENANASGSARFRPAFQSRSSPSAASEGGSYQYPDAVVGDLNIPS
jgi:hypothetical protein